MATSSRPGPVLVESGGDAAGSGGVMGSDMDDRPDLMQPDHQHGRDEPSYSDDRGAPPGSLHQAPERGGQRDERRRDQVSDERSQPGRAFTTGEFGHDDADLDKQQDLKDANRGEEGDGHSPVQGGHQERVPGKRETGDDDRRGDGAIHGRHVTTFRSNWRWRRFGGGMGSGPRREEAVLADPGAGTTDRSDNSKIFSAERTVVAPSSER